MGFEDAFELVITPKRKWYDFKLKEVWKYKDLIWLFVKRSFSAQYKQTILGPMWFIINPLISTCISTIVFGNIANLSSDGVPYFVFYLTGYCLWNYFSTCVNSTATTFSANSSIMGKVYFPRLTMPIASVLYSAINMLIIFGMILVSAAVFCIKGSNILPNWTFCFVPLYMLQTAALGLGVGILTSALTTKYRDLNILVGFGISLWMYLTPIVYSLNEVGGTLKTLILFNPMTPIIQNFKYAILGIGNFEGAYWILSIIETIILGVIGILLFNKVEKTFMDTV